VGERWGGGLTDDDGGDLGDFADVFVGLHDALDTGDGEFGLDLDAAGGGTAVVGRGEHLLVLVLVVLLFLDDFWFAAALLLLLLHLAAIGGVFVLLRATAAAARGSFGLVDLHLGGVVFGFYVDVFGLDVVFGFDVSGWGEGGEGIFEVALGCVACCDWGGDAAVLLVLRVEGLALAHGGEVGGARSVVIHAVWRSGIVPCAAALLRRD
jgi:hypothetical protein